MQKRMALSQFNFHHKKVPHTHCCNVKSLINKILREDDTQQTLLDHSRKKLVSMKKRKNSCCPQKSPT